MRLGKLGHRVGHDGSWGLEKAAAQLFPAPNFVNQFLRSPSLPSSDRFAEGYFTFMSLVRQEESAR